MPSTQRIRDTAIALLASEPKGLRYGELHKRVCTELPELAPNTVHSGLLTFKHALPAEVRLVSKAHYLHVKFARPDMPDGEPFSPHIRLEPEGAS